MMIKEAVHLEDTTLLNEDSLLIEGGTRKQTSLLISVVLRRESVGYRNHEHPINRLDGIDVPIQSTRIVHILCKLL